MVCCYKTLIHYTFFLLFKYIIKWIVSILIDVKMASNRYFHTRGKEVAGIVVHKLINTQTCEKNKEEEEENVYVKDEFFTGLRTYYKL